MELFYFLGGCVVGGVGGAWGYHTMLKRNPAKLAEMLAAIKDAGKKIEDKIN